MKAKRFLSLLLSLALTASLAAPALAAEESSPLVVPTEEEVLKNLAELGILSGTALSDYYDEFDLEFARQYQEEHPQEYAAFDPDAWFAQEWDFYDSKEEYLADYGLTEELFREDMWVEYVTCTDEYYAAYDEYMARERTRKVEDYRAAHPGELEGLDLQTLLDWQGYEEPMAAFMADWDLDSEEEARETLLELYVDNRLNAEERRKTVELYRAADPESWESFDAQAYFEENWSWYDKDRYMDARGLFTEEEFVEQLYMEHMMGNSLLPGWGYRDNPLSLVVNGWPRQGSAISAENGVSYLPAQELNEILGTHYAGEEPVAIRPAAEEAGWDVVWNRNNNQVVLLDRERLTRGIVLPQEMDVDGQTTDFIEYDLSGFERLVRRLFSLAEQKEGQSYRTTGNCEMALTTFNTLDGDESRKVTLTTDALVRDDVVDLTVTLNAAQVLELLSKPTLDALAKELPKFAFQDLKTLLTGCKAELIWNPGEGRLCWNIPLLSLLEPGAGEVWYSVDLDPDGGLTSEEVLAAIRGEDWSVGELAYEYLLTQSGESYGGASEAYSNWMQGYGMLNGLFGADTVTEKDGSITWALTGERLNQIISSVAGSFLWSYYDGEESPEWNIFKEYDLSMTIDRQGKVTSSAAVRPDMDALAGAMSGSEWMGVGETALMTWLLNLLDFRYTARTSGDAGHAQGRTEVHWKNQFKAELETVTDRREVKDAPRTAPPAGAEIIEL